MITSVRRREHMTGKSRGGNVFQYFSVGGHRRFSECQNQKVNPEIGYILNKNSHSIPRLQ